MFFDFWIFCLDFFEFFCRIFAFRVFLFDISIIEFSSFDFF